jgi:hypothetical protein
VPGVAGVLLVVASLANGAPSIDAVRADILAGDLSENDISGSGFEAGGCRESAAGASEPGETKDRRHWLEMAARCRNLARWHKEDARLVLLRLADEYERRAERLRDPNDGLDG